MRTTRKAALYIHIHVHIHTCICIRIKWYSQRLSINQSHLTSIFLSPTTSSFLPFLEKDPFSADPFWWRYPSQLLSFFHCTIRPCIQQNCKGQSDIARILLDCEGKWERGYARTCVNRNCTDYAFPLLPPTSLAHTRKIKAPVRCLCQETLSNSAASANIHHWRQKMGKFTNGISRRVWDWVANPPACPECLRPWAPVPALQRGKCDSSDKPPRGRGLTRCPPPPRQMGTVGTPGLPGPTAEAEVSPAWTHPCWLLSGFHLLLENYCTGSTLVPTLWEELSFRVSDWDLGLVYTSLRNLQWEGVSLL